MIICAEILGACVVVVAIDVGQAAIQFQRVDTLIAFAIVFGTRVRIFTISVIDAAILNQLVQALVLHTEICRAGVGVDTACVCNTAFSKGGVDAALETSAAIHRAWVIVFADRGVGPLIDLVVAAVVGAVTDLFTGRPGVTGGEALQQAGSGTLADAPIVRGLTRRPGALLRPERSAGAGAGIGDALLLLVSLYGQGGFAGVASGALSLVVARSAAIAPFVTEIKAYQAGKGTVGTIRCGRAGATEVRPSGHAEEDGFGERISILGAGPACGTVGFTERGADIHAEVLSAVI